MLLCASTSSNVNVTIRGKFLTLEGLEGVGKTTNRAVIEAQLASSAIDYIATREPGGTPIGEQLRSLLLHDHGDLSAETELLLMAASRKEHVLKVIEPALSKGQWVLCDRFIDASVAYQGAGRDLGCERVVRLHQLIDINLKPDLTLLLDLPVETGLARMAARGSPDRIESEAREFFERARSAYLERAHAEPDRIKVIDASGSEEKVKMAVESVVGSLISQT